jgi:hypothetical protein
MSGAHPRDHETVEALWDLGEAAGRALVAADPGDADGESGWRGALQVAADVTDGDDEVLRVADETYALASQLTSVSRVVTFAEVLRTTVEGPAACAFLDGVADGADEGLSRDGVH